MPRLNYRDLDMLKSPGRWSAWPVLPVKRDVGADFPELGLVVENVATRPVVYIQNLFSLKPGPLGPQVTGCVEHVYATLEAMLADGWVVD
jgi:hypothetical protein